MYIGVGNRKFAVLSDVPEHKDEIYGGLCLLITEQKQSEFHEKLQLFMQYWQDKEPEFICYFKAYYSQRVGMV